MRTMYIECNMGAAGDMLMAALLELIPDADAFLQRMNGLGIPGVKIAREQAVRCGITGTHMAVTVHGEEEESHDHHHEHGHAHDHDHEHEHSHHHYHEHAGLHDIEHLLGHLPISDAAKGHALAVYQLIAEAESHAHGVPVTQVHFHEVGAMDAVADIVGVCLLMEQLAPERVVVSPVHVGSGQVKCAHGILPVPAPATAYILRGVPSYGGDIRGELCTPTGAALLKHFATGFGPMPVMAVDAIGYGMGKKDFPAANCVRVMLGEDAAVGGPGGEIVSLSCTLDDMTGEDLSVAQAALMKAGALDVTVTAVQMKKGRPGHVLECLCAPGDADAMAAAMLAHTTTLGVRRAELTRYTLGRVMRTVETPYGPVHVKVSEGYGVRRVKAEFEDLRAAAEAHGVTVAQVRASVDTRGV